MKQFVWTERLPQEWKMKENNDIINLRLEHQILTKKSSEILTRNWYQINQVIIKGKKNDGIMY